MARRYPAAIFVTFTLGIVGGMISSATAEAGPVVPRTPPKDLPAGYVPPACVGAVHRVQPGADEARCGGEVVIPCFPYACDARGKACGSACTRDNECAAGARCDLAARQCAPERAPAAAPCPTVCATKSGESTSVKERAFNPATNKCEVVAVSSCAPFTCDQTTGMCNFECVSGSECAPGTLCNPQTKVCGYAIPVCGNRETLVLGSGQQLPCSPYACAAGQCGTQCATNNDCAAKHACTQGKCTPTK